MEEKRVKWGLTQTAAFANELYVPRKKNRLRTKSKFNMKYHGFMFEVLHN